MHDLGIEHGRGMTVDEAQTDLDHREAQRGRDERHEEARDERGAGRSHVRRSCR